MPHAKMLFYPNNTSSLVLRASTGGSASTSSSTTTTPTFSIAPTTGKLLAFFGSDSSRAMMPYSATVQACPPRPSFIVHRCTVRLLRIHRRNNGDSLVRRRQRRLIIEDRSEHLLLQCRRRGSCRSAPHLARSSAPQRCTRPPSPSRLHPVGQRSVLVSRRCSRQKGPFLPKEKRLDHWHHPPPFRLDFSPLRNQQLLPPPISRPRPVLWTMAAVRLRRHSLPGKPHY